MNKKDSGGNRLLEFAEPTHEDVISRPAYVGQERGHFPTVYPTERANIISPQSDRKIKQSLKRAALLRALGLQLRYLAVEFRHARLRVLRGIFHHLTQFLEYAAHFARPAKRPSIDVQF
jgi:hypothetical protein